MSEARNAVLIVQEACWRHLDRLEDEKVIHDAATLVKGLSLVVTFRRKGSSFLQCQNVKIKPGDDPQVIAARMESEIMKMAGEAPDQPSLPPASADETPPLFAMIT